MSGIDPALDSLISSGFHQNICICICIQYLYLFSVFVFVHNEEEKICLAKLQPGFSDLIRLFWLFLLLDIHLMMMIMTMMIMMMMQPRFSDFISLLSVFLLFRCLNILISTAPLFDQICFFLLILSFMVDITNLPKRTHPQSSS